LSSKPFAPIPAFLGREAQRYGVPTVPLIEIGLGPEVNSLPPAPPDPPTVLGVMSWSLRLRWWAHQALADFEGTSPDVRLFVIFHRPGPGKVLDHSLGLERGHIGVVHTFGHEAASQSNNVVIAHELLHTAGASDKYDAKGRPLYPDGYAEPDRDPRHPQQHAELMAGRIPLDETRARMPKTLFECSVGPLTAKEINWTHE
jgi:hypothetical protein